MKNNLKYFDHKLAKVGTFVLWLFKKRIYIYVALLITLSTYKPHALFLTLSMAQTFMNIAMNSFIDVSVGAAVFLHNIF